MKRCTKRPFGKPLHSYSAHNMDTHTHGGHVMFSGQSKSLEWVPVCSCGTAQRSYSCRVTLLLFCSQSSPNSCLTSLLRPFPLICTTVGQLSSPSTEKHMQAGAQTLRLTSADTQKTHCAYCILPSLLPHVALMWFHKKWIKSVPLFHARLHRCQNSLLAAVDFPQSDTLRKMCRSSNKHPLLAWMCVKVWSLSVTLNSSWVRLGLRLWEKLSTHIFLKLCIRMFSMLQTIIAWQKGNAICIAVLYESTLRVHS